MTAAAETNPAVIAAYNLVRDFSIRFEVDMMQENGLDIRVDYGALFNLAMSYVDDITRYKAYHDTEVPDRARRSAYLCKWLMKFRPIVVLNPEAIKTEEINTFRLLANEIFAMYCISGLMEIDWSDLSDKIRIITLYSLRHRYNSEDTYILFFALLTDL